MPENKIVKRAAIADQDLVRLWHHIGQHDAEAADRYVHRIIDAHNSLAQFPYRGAPSRTLGDDIRRRVVGDYVTFYNITPAEVRILRVFHQREDADRGFDGMA
jgi:toxin ParE1/3/4